jgi:2-C-methyl-D-erythritol 4-phosphate cytidylyltransferase
VIPQDAAAILVAGGQGLRFGGRVRKQYLTLCGHPLLWWPLRAFDQCHSIEMMVLVVPAEDLERLRSLVPTWKLHKPVHVVSGGKSRAGSVYRGLAALPPQVRWVAVHDAVRPLVTSMLIEKVLKVAQRHRAAIAAAPSKDTVKLSRKNHTILRTLSRDTIWLAQTPQIFDRSLLEQAHQKNHHSAVTDDAQMVERLGVRVKLVESSPDNLKVTLPPDFAMAQLLLKDRY